MAIDTNNTTNGAQGAGSAGSAAAGIAPNGDVSQLFTTLLVAQIRNQNPLEPTDPSAFVTQLTQLSQMEALQTLTKQGTANGAALDSLQVLQLGGQIGSQVTVGTDRIDIDGEQIKGKFELANGSESVSLVIESESGAQQRVPLGTLGAGAHEFAIDPAKLGLVNGTYSVRVETDDKQAAPLVEVQGTLRSVKLSQGGGVTLDVSHVGETDASAVTAFNGRQATSH
jgi:flagellar basal-body rod modification protein FlgD